MLFARERISAVGGLSSVGTWVPETKMGRTYLRPTSGTYEGPQRNAFSAPRVGRASSVVLCTKFVGFEVDNSRSCAK